MTPSRNADGDRQTDSDQGDSQKITHGRHCICSACAAQDWAAPGLAPCGMHGPACANAYQPWGRAGQLVTITDDDPMIRAVLAGARAYREALR